LRSGGGVGFPAADEDPIEAADQRQNCEMGAASAPVPKIPRVETFSRARYLWLRPKCGGAQSGEVIRGDGKARRAGFGIEQEISCVDASFRRSGMVRTVRINSKSGREDRSRT